MKKIIIVFVLLCPMFINAACDRDLQSTYVSYAQDISYETEYSKSQSRFTVTLYNVIDDMTIKFNNKSYPVKENQVVIGDVKEGTKMQINIYGKSGCSDPVRTIYINQPYYNNFFGSTICHGYENKITYCTHKFTDILVTERLIETAKENVNNILEQEGNIKPDEPKTVFQIISEFAKTWGVRIILVLVTSFLTNWFFNDKYIKVKHKL